MLRRFFNIIFISVEYPRPYFFGLLAWQFVNITFRDGDVKGQFEQHYLCRSCKKGKEFERELRSTWRMLAINNCLSEVVATLAVRAASRSALSGDFPRR